MKALFEVLLFKNRATVTSSVFTKGLIPHMFTLFIISKRY